MLNAFLYFRNKTVKNIISWKYNKLLKGNVLKICQVLVNRKNTSLFKCVVLLKSH